MSSTMGNKLRLTIFGQSHGAAVGGVLDGFPPGMRVDFDALEAFSARRRPGQNALSTARKEADIPEFLSGLRDGVTCDAPLAFVLHNTDTRSGDYEKLADCPRPSHSDWPAHVHSGGQNDVRGGGHFSARLTAPLCIAGALCLQALAARGIHVGAHIASIAGIPDERFDPVTVSPELFRAIAAKPFPTIDDEAGARMQQAVLDARTQADSVGGVVECAVTGLSAGLGGPMFDTVEGRLAYALFGVPAVKGLEFGSGFAGSGMRGSENNDPYRVENGVVRTESNHAGGILGGLTTGMPIVFRAAFKPTPSIGRPQRSVSLSRMENTELVIKGRHDPCIVPRAVPVVEAATAVTILDILLEG